MPPTPDEIIATAERIAQEVLFPNAPATDAADLLPRSNLDALAEAGLYGFAGPVEAGGLGADWRTINAVIEVLAGGCLTTAFVFIQHQTPVRAVAATTNTALRDAWLAPLCAGERRSGIALGALRPGPATLIATPAPGGWTLDGAVPWATGWERVDAMLAAARTEDGRVVRGLIDAAEGPALRATPLRLVAANASGTVALRFERLFLPDERVTSVEPYVPPPAHDAGGRGNGSLALGVASRCIRLAESASLARELDQCRERLETSSEETMADARAAASELAYRAAAHLIVTAGSRSITVQHQAQRLARESLFLLVFGTRPAIRAALLQRLEADR